jgi:hypothetical protein
VGQLSEDQKQRLEIFLKVFRSGDGQRVLEELRKDYCDSCFDENPYKTAFNEGRRQVVLDIEWALKYSDQEKLVEMEADNG